MFGWMVQFSSNEEASEPRSITVELVEKCPLFFTAILSVEEAVESTAVVLISVVVTTFVGIVADVLFTGTVLVVLDETALDSPVAFVAEAVESNDVALTSVVAIIISLADIKKVRN